MTPRIFLLAALLTSAACSNGAGAGGGSNDAGGSNGPPVDSSKPLSTLSASELAALCDWSAQVQGGYGASAYCEASGEHLETPQNQAQCISEVTPHYNRPTCTTTVGQWTACTRWFVANWCSVMPPARPAECDAFQARCYGNPSEAGAD